MTALAVVQVAAAAVGHPQDGTVEQASQVKATMAAEALEVKVAAAVARAVLVVR